MLRVLVIDDNQDTRDLIRAILETEGYAVTLADDGEEGLAAQRLAPVDLVITDIFMPNRDGLETIESMRMAHPNVKIVAMSGGGTRVKGPGYLSTARELGAHALLGKPFERNELIRVVRELLDRGGSIP